jgi:hypothetical protein
VIIGNGIISPTPNKKNPEIFLGWGVRTQVPKPKIPLLLGLLYGVDMVSSVMSKIV